MHDNKQRSNRIDYIRCMALLMVLLGHTLTGSTDQSESSFAFRLIWSLQMPLFFLISGYVTRFSRKIDSFPVLVIRIVRRTFQLLWPFAIWTFLIRGVLFGQTQVLQIKWLVYHMDSAYWFLFSLWVISLEHLCAEYLTCVFLLNKRICGYILFFGLIMALLVTIMILMGRDFLGGKLTLYYSAFYLIGAMPGIDNIIASLSFRTVRQYTVLGIIIWGAILWNYDFYSSPDTLSFIVFRFASSLIGCASIFGLFEVVGHCHISLIPVRRVLLWIGRHTLEIYLVHYFYLNIITVAPHPNHASLLGLCVVSLDFFITLLLSSLTTAVLSITKFSRLFFFGKETKKVLSHGQNDTADFHL